MTPEYKRALEDLHDAIQRVHNVTPSAVWAPNEGLVTDWVVLTAFHAGVDDKGDPRLGYGRYVRDGWQPPHSTAGLMTVHMGLLGQAAV